MALLQGDDQPPDSTFDECYILPQSNKQTPLLFFEKMHSCQHFVKLNQKIENLICHITAALTDFHTVNSPKS